MHALLVILERLAAARSFRVRYVPIYICSLRMSTRDPIIFQSCLKRGLGATCAYPDPEAPVDHSQQQTPGSSSLISFVPMSAEATCVAPGIPPFPAAPISYMQPPSLTHQQYYEYNGSFTGASTSTFRPNKRPRPLTEEEAAAITRNFSRGDFFIGTSAPIRIDPRLPVRLMLGEGDHVHFMIGETLV